LSHRRWYILPNTLNTYYEQANRQNIHVWNSRRQHAAQLFRTTPTIGSFFEQQLGYLLKVVLEMKILNSICHKAVVINTAT